MSRTCLEECLWTFDILASRIRSSVAQPANSPHRLMAVSRRFENNDRVTCGGKKHGRTPQSNTGRHTEWRRGGASTVGESTTQRAQCVCVWGGCSYIVRGRRRMTIDPCTPKRGGVDKRLSPPLDLQPNRTDVEPLCITSNGASGGCRTREVRPGAPKQVG